MGMRAQGGVRTPMTAHEQTPSMMTKRMTMKRMTIKRTRTVTVGAVSPLPQHFVWGGFFFSFSFLINIVALPPSVLHG